MVTITVKTCVIWAIYTTSVTASTIERNVEIIVILICIFTTTNSMIVDVAEPCRASAPSLVSLRPIMNHVMAVMTTEVKTPMMPSTIRSFYPERYL